MASEDLFAEEFTENPVAFVDTEIEEVTEEVQATELDTELLAETESSTTDAKHKVDRSSESKLVQLPLARIRNIMKLDPDLHIASNEAVFCVTRATEIFIASLARETYNCTALMKKKTIQQKDVFTAIGTVENLEFLDGAMF